MRLVFFGAGASAAPSACTPEAPPLGKDLFDKLRGAYPETWGKIPFPDRHKFVPNFEEGMGELWDADDVRAPVLLRCMADYFAAFRPAKGNLYSAFLERLAKGGLFEGTIFSTLNYECILEYAGRELGYRIRYDPAGPSTGRDMAVLKVHGSCNFLPKEQWADPAGVPLAPSSVSWDGPAMTVDCSKVAAAVRSNAFYPAMAVYMRNKPVNSCPSIVRGIQDRWKQAVLGARAIAIVGVKPNPEDQHVWKPLEETRAPIATIGGLKEVEDWASRKRKGKPTRPLPGRFGDSLGLLVDFLRNPADRP